MASGARLKKFLLRYYPPGVIMEYADAAGQLRQVTSRCVEASCVRLQERAEARRPAPATARAQRPPASAEDNRFA